MAEQIKALVLIVCVKSTAQSPTWQAQRHDVRTTFDAVFKTLAQSIGSEFVALDCAFKLAALRFDLGTCFKKNCSSTLITSMHCMAQQARETHKGSKATTGEGHTQGTGNKEEERFTLRSSGYRDTEWRPKMVVARFKKSILLQDKQAVESSICRTQ